MQVKLFEKAIQRSSKKHRKFFVMEAHVVVVDDDLDVDDDDEADNSHI